jgi:hypothetical protein
MSDPTDVTLDTSGNVYVSNYGLSDSSNPSVTVYPAGASGTVTPIQTITGSNTELYNPMGIALDSNRDIYVTNYGSSSIAEYAEGASGNVAPMQIISGSSTGLNRPWGIAVDNAGEIYIGNAGGDDILVFSPGSGGNVAPTRVISGSNTGLGDPTGVALDSAGNLYVSNPGPHKPSVSIKIYAAGANGNIAPTRTIVGKSTQLQQPMYVALDASSNIYVSNFFRNKKTNDDDSAVTVYAAGSSGNAPPIQRLTGPKTSLDFANGLAVH